MSKLEKIYHLHDILRSRRTPIGRQDLMQRLGCSQATLYRLIASLRDELGAPIEQDPEGRGFYYDRELPSFELPGFWLSAEQVQSLVAAQALLSRMQPGLLDEELEGLRARISGLLTRHGLDDRTAARFIRIIHHAGREAPREVFRAALTALVAGRRLRIAYAARTRGETTEREVSPQRLTAYRESWYLDAWCHLRSGLRSFSLERITRIDPADRPRKALDEGVLNEHFQSAYGIFAGPARQTARLRFSAAAARWVRDERWHSRQEGRFLDDGRYELAIPFGRSEELVMDLMRYGPDVEVLEPAELRAELRQRLAAALALYGGPS